MCYAMQSYWDEAYTHGETDGINKGITKGEEQGRDNVLDKLVADNVISRETAMKYRKMNSNKA